MAQVSTQHVQPLTMGFVGLLILSIGMIAVLNRAANK